MRQGRDDRSLLNPKLLDWSFWEIVSDKTNSMTILVIFGYYDLLYLIWANFKDILAMKIDVREIRTQWSKPIKKCDDNVTLRHDRFRDI